MALPCLPVELVLSAGDVRWVVWRAGSCRSGRAAAASGVEMDIVVRGRRCHRLSRTTMSVSTGGVRPDVDVRTYLCRVVVLFSRPSGLCLPGGLGEGVMLGGYVDVPVRGRLSQCLVAVPAGPGPVVPMAG